MNKNVQRIVVFLLVALTAFGMFPAALATDIGPEDTMTDPTLPAENDGEGIPAEDTTPTGETAEPTTPIEEAPPASEMGEEVTASRIGIGAENVPMVMATRAAVQGTHYHRAIIWLSGSESKLDFTYKGKDYSVNRLYVHGVITGGKRYTVYCVDPGVNTKEGTGGYSSSDTSWNDLDIDTQTAVGLALLYGAPNNLYSTDPKTMLTYEFATQIIITEIILGFRSNLPPYECTDNRIIQKFGTNTDGTHNGYGRYISSDSVDYSSVHGQNMDRTLLKNAYDTIAANMASHYVLPSFASRYNAAAKTYEMTQQSDGTYSVTLTDTNNILSKCTFKNDNGLTYSVSGNKLTIKSKTAFDTPKSCALTSAGGASKNVPSLEKQSFLLWSSGSYQRLVNLQEASSDPVPLYFNVIAKESKGTAQIIKKATNGGSVSGWTFTVKNASGTTIGTYTTDSTGVIAVDLEPGTYSVTEKATTDKYWVNDATSTRKVTVKASETASVTFTNQRKGKAQIVKTARGLSEINTSKVVYPGASMVNFGLSDCTLRIAYQATMDSDDSVVFGDNGNPNEVVLTWKRSNSAYYDTLVDDCHLYTYGIELTKLFSDGQGNYRYLMLHVANKILQNHHDAEDAVHQAFISIIKNLDTGPERVSGW